MLDITVKFNEIIHHVAVIFIMHLHFHKNVYLRRISKNKAVVKEINIKNCMVKKKRKDYRLKIPEKEVFSE